LGQGSQNIIQQEIFRDHFLVGVQRETNLAGTNLPDNARLDFL